MSKGDISLPEAVELCDPETGHTIRQITNHPSIHHHPFYYVPAFDDAMRWLYFVSHRSGAPQFYAERRESGEIIQLTERDDLNEWSFHPSHDGDHLYFTTTDGGWRLEMDSLSEEKVVDFGGATKSKGMVGAGMGTTTLSHDDCWWAIPVRRGNLAELMVVHTESLEAEVVCENVSIGHPQFHPNDSNMIRYGGPYDRRIWVVHRDGGQHRLIYDRDASQREWIVHECWRPNSREILTTNWPLGVMAIDVDSGEWRWVTKFNAWHPMVNPSGTCMVSDTKNPDIGLQIFDVAEQQTLPALLCRSDASSVGDHWDVGHCPYDEGPIDVYAPQHTHPHPSFSPDGRRVVFTSDRSGHAQLYEVQIPETR